MFFQHPYTTFLAFLCEILKVRKYEMSIVFDYFRFSSCVSLSSPASTGISPSALSN